jgi:hypothetical protein
MDAAVVAGKVEALKGRKDGSSRAMLKVNSALGTPCLGSVGLKT